MQHTRAINLEGLQSTPQLLSRPPLLLQIGYPVSAQRCGFRKGIAGVRVAYTLLLTEIEVHDVAFKHLCGSPTCSCLGDLRTRYCLDFRSSGSFGGILIRSLGPGALLQDSLCIHNNSDMPKQYARYWVLVFQVFGGLAVEEHAPGGAALRNAPARQCQHNRTPSDNSLPSQSRFNNKCCYN